MARRLDRLKAERQPALIGAYREGLSLTAIAVTRDAAGALRVDSMSPGRAPAPGDNVENLWWCRHPGDAARVAKAAAARIGRHERENGAADGYIASRAVEIAARQCDVALYSDERISAAALAAIARVDNELAKLQQAGELKSINRSYRAYREEAAARGERVLPYVRWLDKYKEKLVRELAAALRHG